MHDLQATGRVFGTKTVIRNRGSCLGAESSSVGMHPAMFVFYVDFDSVVMAMDAFDEGGFLAYDVAKVS